MSIFSELDERDTKRALMFVQAHIDAGRGNNAGMAKVLDQMRNGELDGVRTMLGMSEIIVGLMGSQVGPETVEDRIAASLIRLGARCDQLDAEDRRA